MRIDRKVLAALAAAGVLAVAGCGGDDDESGSGPGNEVDQAFAAEMVGHHEAAIDMAKLAERRAEHPEIEILASNIERTQGEEIEELGGLGQDVGAPESTAEHSGEGHEGGGSPALGLSAEEMGLEHDIPALREADPFDREFIDQMIPHHEGAIAMARVQAERGSSAELKDLAERIIEAQTKEIRDMRAWREDWYGS